jgi:hypothetical protein
MGEMADYILEQADYFSEEDFGPEPEDEVGYDPNGYTAFENTKAKAETERGLLVVIKGEELWFPKRFIPKSSEVQSKGDSGLFVVATWLAEKKELVEED